jgi:hypothetical protein
VLSDIAEGIQRLRVYWPQSHAVEGERGHHLIVVPSVVPARGYDKSICTVLFIAPAGFPAARPWKFWTDAEIRLANNSFPRMTTWGCDLADYGWPQWKDLQLWHWKLQMWNPNTDTLFTFMNVIKERLCAWAR